VPYLVHTLVVNKVKVFQKDPTLHYSSIVHSFPGSNLSIHFVPSEY